MKLPSFVLLASLTCGTAASAQERQWIVQDFLPDGLAVMYATPDSDDVALAIRCDVAAGRVTVTFEHEPARPSPDGRVGLTLGSEAGEIAFDASVERLDEIGVTLLEARVVSNPALAAILERGETLRVTVEDGAEDLPLAGSAHGFSRLFSTCAQ